jgi:UDP-glucose 4-epimerase
MKIAITGGAGFIGANLVRFLNTHFAEAEISVIDDLSLGLKENLDGRQVEFYEGSILDQDLLTRALKGADSVVHLAAIGSVPRSVAYPFATHEANATGTLAVLEVAKNIGVEQVIVASSSSVYGSNPALPKKEEDWTRPMSPYGVSKLATEAYALAYQHSYGLKTLAFRFFNVYGPLQRADHPYAAVIPKFLDAAITQGGVTIFGDGTQTRDFTYVDSVCAVITDAITRRLSNASPLNLAFGTRTSLLDLVSVIEQELESSLDIKFEPARPGDIKDSQANPEKLHQGFPEVQPTPLVQGVHRTAQWFQSRP